MFFFTTKPNETKHQLTMDNPMDGQCMESYSSTEVSSGKFGNEAGQIKSVQQK